MTYKVEIQGKDKDGRTLKACFRVDHTGSIKDLTDKILNQYGVDTKYRITPELANTIDKIYPEV
jgi:hypothetical protein